MKRSGQHNQEIISRAACKLFLQYSILKDGDSIDIDDLHSKVLYTPSHSQDSISIYGDGVLFSGDTFLTTVSVGQILPAAAMSNWNIVSKKKFYVLSDNTVVYPGHGQGNYNRRKKRGNSFVK